MEMHKNTLMFIQMCHEICLILLEYILVILGCEYFAFLVSLDLLVD
jgi:hypothetical protein